MSAQPPTIGQSKMNVLLVLPWDDARGGVVSVVHNLARSLRQGGHGALIFHPFGPFVIRNRTSALGLPGVRMRLTIPGGPGISGLLRTLLSPLFVPFNLLQLIWLLRSRGIQIVNLHYPNDHFVYFAICRRLLSIRLVTSVHGRDAFYQERPKDEYSRAFRYVLDSSDLVVLPSDAYRRKLLEAFPHLDNRTIFIHNGVDTAEFNSTPRAWAGGKRFVLCVAELQEYKAIDVLLRAMQPLLADDPALTLVLAGDGPLRRELESLAVSLGIRHRTMFLGSQGAPEIVRLLHDCDVMVLPSRMEPFGIVLLEAMACRAPVVATRVGGIPEIVEHDVTGVLVEADDAAALTAGLRRVLADAGLRNTIAENGYAKVMERFRSTHNGAAYLNMFAGLRAGFTGHEPTSRVPAAPASGASATS